MHMFKIKWYHTYFHVKLILVNLKDMHFLSFVTPFESQTSHGVRYFSQHRRSAPKSETSEKRQVVRRVTLIGQPVDLLQLRLADQ